MTIIDLEKSLSELHQEIEKLIPAVKLAEKALECVEIAKAIPEKHLQLIEQIKSVFVNPDELKKKEFVNVYERITNLLTELNLVKEQLVEYCKKIIDLVEYLKNNDIPKKLEAINFQLTSINNSLLAVQGQLSSIQSALNSISSTVDNIRQNTEKILFVLKSFMDDMDEKIKSLQNVLNSISNTVGNIEQNTEKIIADVKLSKDFLEEKMESFELATSLKFESIEKRHNNQDKEIKTLKRITIAISVILVVGIIITILILKKVI